MSAFFDVYSGLGREGPGTAADVHWALERSGIPADAAICDAGAGSGADSATLAAARPGARITTIEQAPSLAAEARARLADLPNVQVVEGDMAAPGGPYDLIWSAGAIYFLGVTEGLSAWRAALAPAGTVAFSEPCWLLGTPSDAARSFWAEYPAITGLGGIETRIEAAGYALRDTRMIVGAPWEAYYSSLEARIAALRPDASLEQAEVIAAAEAEIAAWRKAPDEIAYALCLAVPR